MCVCVCVFMYRWPTLSAPARDQFASCGTRSFAPHSWLALSTEVGCPARGIGGVSAGSLEVQGHLKAESSGG